MYFSIVGGKYEDGYSMARKVLYQSGEHLLDPCLWGIVGPADPSMTMLLAPLTAVDRLDVLEVAKPLLQDSHWEE